MGPCTPDSPDGDAEATSKPILAQSPQKRCVGLQISGDESHSTGRRSDVVVCQDAKQHTFDAPMTYNLHRQGISDLHLRNNRAIGGPMTESNGSLAMVTSPMPNGLHKSVGALPRSIPAEDRHLVSLEMVKLENNANGRVREKDLINGDKVENASDPGKRLDALDSSIPTGRRSIQFARQTINPDQLDTSHARSGSWDPADVENPKDRRAATLFHRLRSKAHPATTQHARSSSAYFPGADAADERFPTSRLSPRSERHAALTASPANEENSEVDADAEESPREDRHERSVGPRRRRRNRRPQEEGSQTVPSTPKSAAMRPSRPNFFSSNTFTPTDRFRPSFLPRRATMTDMPEDTRQGLCEDEGRDRMQRNSPWRRGSAWMHGPRGLSYGGSRKAEPQSPNETRRPMTIRRFTGFGSNDDPNAPAFSPWKSFKDTRTSTVSAAKWRQLKAGIRMIGQRRKAENTVDHAKSAELLAELTAGVPAALILASMFQRDEHGNKRIPILLEQLKIQVTDSKHVDSKAGDRHMIFRIELEYGNGPTRMKWVIHRALRDFANLHARYKLQRGTQKYIQLKPSEARTKLPHFPRSTFPYLRGIRGLESDSEDEDERKGEASGHSGGETSGTDDVSKKKRARPILTTKRRKSSNRNIASTGESAGDNVGNTSVATMRRDPFAERQRKKLELYLQHLIRYLIFRAESNRLCRFLELSALGVRLAAEGSYHGKEGLLIIQSGKGVDFRKAWTPALVKGRHGPKWFCVRHSYVVCVDSPEAMNIYDVFLVDAKFQVQTNKKRLRDQKPRDFARTAKESATHPKNHSLVLSNTERRMKLLAKNERQLHQFEESISHMSQSTPWSKPNRFDSFAPLRSNVHARWLVDGRDHMWNVSRAISMAKDVIYIHDWWLTPELYMRRPAAISQKWRLDRLLQRKAQEGVKVFVIVYRNIDSAIPIDSEYSKFSLLDLHPNVFVQRSPNQMRQSTFFWAHHEKLCIVDHVVAFVGGIDLCFGRWDTPQHSVVDDKMTGFELSDMPKDADHCQMWPGKDYSNPRVQDFYALDKPYEEMYDRSKVPRMPWHDISMQVIGQPARDLTRHFVQRWNFVLRQRKPTRPTPFLLPPPDFKDGDVEALGLSGSCEVQMLRSTTLWSIGTPDTTESSILKAYVKSIEESEHFVYIENQFFITSCDVNGTRVENGIGTALVERISRAAEKEEDWRAVILIPLMPGFQNAVDSQDGTSVRLIMDCQYKSICRGAASIFERLRDKDIEPEKYIQFYGLRSWGKIGPDKRLVTEQLYIHAKCMIVDDKVAIIGSANINERSMLGSRDSECAAVVRDTDLEWSIMNGKPYQVGRFAHHLRMRLMREHLGIDVDDKDENDSDNFEHNMDEVYDSRISHPFSRSDHETERALASKQDLRDELVDKSEKLHSFNHDVDWEQEANPNLMSNKRLTRDPRVTENVEHEKDVAGEGVDHFQIAEKVGIASERDTLLSGDGIEILQDLDPTDQKSSSPDTLGTRKQSVSGPPKISGTTSPPSQTSVHSNATHHSRYYTSQSPATPPTKNTDSEGPGPQHGKSGNRTAHLLATEIKQPAVDKDCIKDPLNNTFNTNTWQAIAENNTKLYRSVFRCMPDNDVQTWEHYREYTLYAERFAQAQGFGKSKDRVHPHNEPSITGPPGQGSTADRLRMLGPIGEKAGDVEEKTETLGDKIMNSLPLNNNKDNGVKERARSMIEEWAEKANRSQFERQAKELAARQQSPDSGETIVNEKAGGFGGSLDEFAPLKPEATLDSANMEKSITPPSVNYSDALNQNVSQQTRRRRATTKSSKKQFQATEDLMSKSDAEALMSMVQGHLVVWPYDWLLSEQGHWLYSLDHLAPLEIYIPGQDTSYLVRWVDVKAECTISWSIQPHKKSIRFGIFKHPGGGIAPTPKLPSSTFEGPPTPGLYPTDSPQDPLQQPEASSAAVEKLKSIGLKPITWHGTCEANKVTTGRWDVPRDEGGMYALVFDNTFAKQLSKTVTFVLLIYPTHSFPSTNHRIQRHAAANGGTTQENLRSRIKLGPRDSSDSVSQIETPLSEAADTEPQHQAQGKLGDERSNQFSGTLRKRRRKKHQGFARRYFLLDFSTATLSYYHDRNNASIRGAIPLSLAAIGANGKTRDISIDSGAEIWHLRASNAKDFEAWKSALEFARTSCSPLSPLNNIAVDTNATKHTSIQFNPEEEREWAKVESLVNRMQKSREIARLLAKDTDPRYLPLGVPKPPFERESTASSASESPSEQSLGQSFPSESERRSFWKRKPNCEKATSKTLKRSVSAQPSTTPSRSMPSTPNESTITSAANRSLASHAEEGLHDHCLSLLQELDKVASEFAIVLAESKQRRALIRPTPVSTTSRYSLDTLGDSQEFYDAETGDSSQFLAIQHETEDEDDKSDHEPASDDDSASEVEASGTAGLEHAPQAATASAYPPKPHSLTPLPSQWVKRRTVVPPPTVAAPSLIGFLRKNVGKDLSTISMPVSANEPLSLLQRASEQLEYSHLLDSAATYASQSSTQRLLYITAFAISTLSYSRVKERAIRKPFNPMLGETYELVREDRGFRLVAEKVSHRPVRMACQAESQEWSFVQAPMPTQKFWGKSAELMTDGKVRVVLHERDERFAWTPATCFLRNIIAGEKYVEPVGTMTVTNETTGEYALCTFKSKGMFSGRSEEVVVQTFDHYGDELPLGLVGKWTTSLTVTENGHPKDHEPPLWKVDELPIDASKRYGFTSFATQLNEITSMESNKIPPTDSRLRPDQRKLEEGDVDAAEGLKGRLEEAQRRRRKEQENSGE
ncbi:MAG: hypothetical protein Q9213_007988, partial [Squamulea squamosa]